MAANDQKLRTLYLMQILMEETDEEHILNAADLTRILKQKYDMDIDRRTIYSDVEIMERFGINIVQVKGKKSGYYVAEREFEMAELKLLVDAVQASKFITEKKSRELIGKLETLCSKSQAEQLSRQVVIYNRPKTSNETIYYNVDDIHNAFFHDRQISFQYSEWTAKKELRLKKDGKFYVVSPWSLTWNDENYYLIAYDEAANKIKHYRVDKMRRMSILDKERVGEEQFENFNLATFAKKTFGMYGGKDAQVKLLCKNELAGVVLDRFGQDVWMVPEGNTHFTVKVMVAVSSQFFGWVTGIGPQMKILGPQEVKEEYKAYLQEIAALYS